jgi:hypothetical protein
MECQLGRASRERLGHLRSLEIASNANNRGRKEASKQAAAIIYIIVRKEKSKAGKRI